MGKFKVGQDVELLEGDATVWHVSEIMNGARAGDVYCILVNDDDEKVVVKEDEIAELPPFHVRQMHNALAVWYRNGGATPELLELLAKFYEKKQQDVNWAMRGETWETAGDLREIIKQVW